MNPLTIMNQPFFPSKFELNILEKIPVVPRIKTSKILTMIKLSAQKIYQNIRIQSVFFYADESICQLDTLIIDRI